MHTQTRNADTLDTRALADHELEAVTGGKATYYQMGGHWYDCRPQQVRPNRPVRLVFSLICRILLRKLEMQYLGGHKAALASFRTASTDPAISVVGAVDGVDHGGGDFRRSWPCRRGPACGSAGRR